MASPAPSILVVDDDTDIREALIDVLTDHGYRVFGVANGREALEHLRSGARPSLILLDLMMPVMDGLTFHREQQADPELRDVPVLMISASHSGPFNSATPGLVGVMSKPIDLDQLLRVVSHHYI